MPKPPQQRPLSGSSSSRDDPQGRAEHRLPRLCETDLGALQSQGYKLIKRAWQQIKLDIDESGIDRQELLSWSIQTLCCGRAGDEAEQSRRSCERHPAA